MNSLLLELCSAQLSPSSAPFPWPLPRIWVRYLEHLLQPESKGGEKRMNPEPWELCNIQQQSFGRKKWVFYCCRKFFRCQMHRVPWVITHCMCLPHSGSLFCSSLLRGKSCTLQLLKTLRIKYWQALVLKFPNFRIPKLMITLFSLYLYL